jgi:hypothetical protein
VGECVRGQRHDLLAPVGGRWRERDVATIAQAGDDLAGALAGDAQLASDLRDRDPRGAAAQA